MRSPAVNHVLVRLVSKLLLSAACENVAMQNCSTERLHSREDASGSRTCENSYRHRHASNPLLEQTLLRSYPSVHCVDKDVRVGRDVDRDVGLMYCVCLV